uniref:MD-2-related lipid-recognition domain-containing protein n=1 Tax=Lutzomyia longipalpis TaxID=7200 RepID=A0A1B0CC81_LUTLO
MVRATGIPAQTPPPQMLTYVNITGCAGTACTINEGSTESVEVAFTSAGNYPRLYVNGTATVAGVQLAPQQISTCDSSVTGTNRCPIVPGRVVLSTSRSDLSIVRGTYTATIQLRIGSNTAVTPILFCSQATLTITVN